MTEKRQVVGDVMVTYLREAVIVIVVHRIVVHDVAVTAKTVADVHSVSD